MKRPAMYFEGHTPRTSLMLYTLTSREFGNKSVRLPTTSRTATRAWHGRMRCFEGKKKIDAPTWVLCLVFEKGAQWILLQSFCSIKLLPERVPHVTFDGLIWKKLASKMLKPWCKFLLCGIRRKILTARYIEFARKSLRRACEQDEKRSERLTHGAWAEKHIKNVQGHFVYLLSEKSENWACLLTTSRSSARVWDGRVRYMAKTREAPT